MERLLWERDQVRRGELRREDTGAVILSLPEERLGVVFEVPIEIPSGVYVGSVFFGEPFRQQKQSTTDIVAVLFFGWSASLSWR